MKKYFRKHSLKIYRSPRLLRYPIPDDPEPSKIKKEVQTQSKKNNINIIKVGPGKMVNEIQQGKINDSTSITNKRYKSEEEKKVVKTSYSKKSSIKSNNKEEIEAKPLKRNNSNAKTISTVNESNKQNIKTTIKNQPLIPTGYNKNNNKTIDIKNTNGSAYTDRRRISNETENKNKKENRPRSQAKPQRAKNEPQVKNQNIYISNQQKINSDVKQSQSQNKIKISSNNPNFKMRQIPVPKNANDKRIPRPTDLKNIKNVNDSKINKVQGNAPTYHRQNTGYSSSNTSRINSKINQDKDNNKTFNTSFTNYTQQTQRNNIPNTQNKNNRIEYKPSYQPQQINTGKYVNNNQAYYSSQTGKSNSNLQKQNIIISENRNKKEYNTITKDNKPKANYGTIKNNNIYESKNVNKENYDKNRSGYSYVVNFNNTKSSGTGNKSIEANKSQRRLVVNN